MLLRVIDQFRDLSQSVDALDEENAKRILEAAAAAVLTSLKGSYICDVLWKDRAGDDIILRPIVSVQSPTIARPKRDNYVLNPSTSKGVWAHVFFNERPVWAVGIRAAVRRSAPIKDEASKTCIKPDSRAYTFFANTESIIVHPLVYREILWGILSVEFKVPHPYNLETLNQIARLSNCVAGTLWKRDVQRINAEDTRHAVVRFEQHIAQAQPTVPLTAYPSCFVARPFARRFDSVHECLKKMLRSEGVKALAYRVSAANTQPMVEDILEQIQAAHFCVADITGANPNVLLEVGVMLAHKKPMVLLQARGDATRVPFDVASYAYHEYRRNRGQLEVLNPSNHRFERFEPQLREYARKWRQNVSPPRHTPAAANRPAKPGLADAPPGPLRRPHRRQQGAA